MQLKDMIFDLLVYHNLECDKDKWDEMIDNWAKTKMQTPPISAVDQIRNCDGKTMSYQWSDK